MPDDWDDFEEQQAPQQEEEPDEIMPIVRLYFKIGGFFKLSWKEFNEMPWPVMKQLAKLIEEKEHDMDQMLGHEEMGMFKNLKRLFPPKSG